MTNRRDDVEHVKDVQLSMGQKVMVTVFAAFAIWLGATVQNTAVSVAVLIDQNQDRYTGTQAAADKAAVNSRIEAVEKRAARLEGKHGL
ncbi:hypothetical protein [Sphingorhabdus sp. SMR4y]|uniref:hypothetical protein n=1 Tax=Sphingorhabdus sp. SMR4y TaxID=2584094 RepID=UPI000B5C58DB|nr:hypothetical protein [Sphingorhabdus sp. SMR4y]ASK88454.1 hypothetical protein SPHFLASMR4Y_01707 [Sphingorhabdus sp. SMR4y]